MEEIEEREEKEREEGERERKERKKRKRGLGEAEENRARKEQKKKRKQDDFQIVSKNYFVCMMFNITMTLEVMFLLFFNPACGKTTKKSLNAQATGAAKATSFVTRSSALKHKQRAEITGES